MSDETRARVLLTRAAELPEDLPVPVTSLIDRARLRRRHQLAAAALTAAAVAVVAIIAPQAAGGGNSQPSGHSGSQVTAAELARFRWHALSTSPLGPRANPVLAWTGHELLEVGGINTAGQVSPAGAAYDPVTRQWRTIAPVRPSIGMTDAFGVWTGRQLFVASPRVASCPGLPGPGGKYCPPATAGLYDPATNQWTASQLPRPMRGLTLDSAVWSGRQVVVAAIGTEPARLAVAAYDPAAHRWKMITPTLPPGNLPRAAAMVATPGRVLLWELWASRRPGPYGVGVLSLGPDDRWRTLTGAWGQDETVNDPAYARGQILIPPGPFWCGPSCSPPVGFGPARLAAARTLSVATVRPVPRKYQNSLTFYPSTWLWNGSAAVVASTTAVTGTGSPTFSVIDRLRAYDPRTRRWHDLRVPRGSPALATDPLWAGRQILLLTAAGKLLAFRH